MNAQLPAALASRQRRSVIADATQGLGSSRGAHISIRGGRFRLISATGVETLINTHYLDVIVIDANDKPARVFFGGPYDPTVDTPPKCFSDNGVGPSTQAMEPQSPTCQTCPHNVRGSATTFSGKPTTGCDNRKKIAVIIPDDPAVNVYEFQIPPGSLSNLKAYGQWIGTQSSGVQGRSMDIADFVTRVEFDPERQFVMKFTPVAFADDERTLQLIEYIDANKLSDAAVGRNDVACEPEQVKAMLAGRPAQQAIAPPAAQAPQTQQFQLPPRQAPQQIAHSQGVDVSFTKAAAEQPAAPKPRASRKPKDEAPAGASVAAPFMAPAVTSGPTAGAPSSTPQPAPNGDAMEIPAFLRRTQDALAPAPSAPPRFNIGQAPTPPAAIADALQAAMNLPTRRG